MFFVPGNVSCCEILDSPLCLSYGSPEVQINHHSVLAHIPVFYSFILIRDSHASGVWKFGVYTLNQVPSGQRRRNITVSSSVAMWVLGVRPGLPTSQWQTVKIPFYPF